MLPHRGIQGKAQVYVWILGSFEPKCALQMAIAAYSISLHLQSRFIRPIWRKCSDLRSFLFSACMLSASAIADVYLNAITQGIEMQMGHGLATPPLWPAWKGFRKGL